MSYSSMCDIEFVHLGMIDIKQLLFASRQHVVAYRIARSMLVDSPPWWQNGNGAPLSWLQGGGGTLEITVKYGTMLHVQYQAPIIALSAASGGGGGIPGEEQQLRTRSRHHAAACPVLGIC